MNRKTLSCLLSPLVAAVDRSGLVELVAGNIAHETILRILDTGDDLGLGIDDDTEATATTLSNPVTWGIPDPRWKAFCEEWGKR